MELEDGGCLLRPGGAEVFGIDARAARAGEPEIEAFDALGGDFLAGNQLGLGIGRVQFAKGFGPVGVEVGGARVAALIGAEFGERFVDEGHDAERKTKVRGLEKSNQGARADINVVTALGRRHGNGADQIALEVEHADGGLVLKRDVELACDRIEGE